jgi:putative SOS response-associated peptidase YedK
MCGRFTLTTSREVLARAFDLEEVPALAPRFNVAPGQDVATIWHPPDEQRALRMRRWGLVPHWARDAKIGSRLINARAETAAEKPAFRVALRRRRCLVPADGFYEWSARGRSPGDRQPYHLALPGREPFAIAGLFEQWRDEAGSLLETCVLLTVPPNDSVRAVHDRMPAILRREDYALWLDPGEVDPARVQALLAPWAGPGLEVQEVSRRVNRPTFDDPACIEPVQA